MSKSPKQETGIRAKGFVLPKRLKLAKGPVVPNGLKLEARVWDKGGFSCRTD